MDCPSCCGKIESAARKVPGVNRVQVSLVTQSMVVEAESPSVLPELEGVVRALGYQVDSVEVDSGAAAHQTPAYRRALLVVVLLNVGFGIVEIVGGFMSQSQALKADALDFLGDGLITGLGLAALHWSTVWRARSALVQGWFLGLLGLGVFASTVYRFWFTQEPRSEVMGILGGIALIVNVLAAAVLLPHRSGDANVKAVWLFSRNDALGNLAVVIAAGLVYWLKSAWPDLIVAAIVASLFLHSAWSIIRDANDNLRNLQSNRPVRPTAQGHYDL